MNIKATKMLLILTTVTVLVISSGCGARGDLYHPSESQSVVK
ncbi:MAG: hypothetical protein OEL79_01280 [Chromatiales bacterium]|nr:hypothetical protein [Chromatiales bacterium]